MAFEHDARCSAPEPRALGVRWRLSLSFVLLAAPLAVAAAAWHWSPVALFCASGLAIVLLARLIGVATEASDGMVTGFAWLPGRWRAQGSCEPVDAGNPDGYT
jgi:hypothetical protein